jgi:hypothetical protein
MQPFDTRGDTYSSPIRFTLATKPIDPCLQYLTQSRGKITIGMGMAYQWCASSLISAVRGDRNQRSTSFRVKLGVT